MAQRILQPDSNTGVDTYINSLSTSGNPEPTAELRVGRFSAVKFGNHNYRSILRFDVTDLLALGLTTVDSATFTLFSRNLITPTAGTTFTLARVLQPNWTETGASWNRYDGVNGWAPGGAYTLVTPVAASTVIGPGENLAFNAKVLVDDALQNRNGVIDLIVIGPEIGSPNFATFHSSEGTSASLRPKLVIDYTPLTLPVEYAPSGRVGIGVVQPQSGTHYPFVAPSDNLKDLIADFHIAYRDRDVLEPGEPAWALPFKIAWIYGLGEEVIAAPDFAPTPVHDVDLLVFDANDDLVFDSTTAVLQSNPMLPNYEPQGYYQETEWGDYRILEWRTSNATCRLVAHTDFDPVETAIERVFPDNLVPDNGELDARTVYRLPKRVTAIMSLLNTFRRENVELLAGYNIELRDAGVRRLGRRRIQRIEIAAVPGTGQGQFPGCTPVTPVIRAINNVQPTDAGGFIIKADDCYWLTTPTTIVDSSPTELMPTYTLTDAPHLQLSNNCAPCCSCDDYVDVAQRLNALAEQFGAIGQTAGSTRDQYHDNRDRWNAQKACRETRPFQVALRAQSCPFMDVLARFCNQTAECRTGISLDIQFVPVAALSSAEDPASECETPVPVLPEPTGNPDVALVCGHTTITTSNPRGTERYNLQGEWPHYRASWASVEPYASVEVRFRLQFPNGGTYPVLSVPTGYAVAAFVTGTELGQNICAGDSRVIATSSAALECPPSAVGAC